MERAKMAEESLETAAEHERILREIESTDTACIGPTLSSFESVLVIWVLEEEFSYLPSPESPMSLLSFLPNNKPTSKVQISKSEGSGTIAEKENRKINSRSSEILKARSVYDGEEHGRFMEKLETRIRNHDREIEKMCNFHYQGFVDSITELLKVRGEAQKLKNQVTDTNRKLQHEGKELVIAMEELKQCRLQQRNISATVDKLMLCLPVLEMYSKLRDQMKTK
ncbi:hypothetical protein STEG23_032025, partial [Scotinomys teguina]